MLCGCIFGLVGYVVFECRMLVIVVKLFVYIFLVIRFFGVGVVMLLLFEFVLVEIVGGVV